MLPFSYVSTRLLIFFVGFLRVLSVLCFLRV